MGYPSLYQGPCLGIHRWGVRNDLYIHIEDKIEGEIEGDIKCKIEGKIEGEIEGIFVRAFGLARSDLSPFTMCVK